MVWNFNWNCPFSSPFPLSSPLSLPLFLLPSSHSKTDGDITGLQSFSLGFAARSLAAATFLPFTVVKTRYEVGQLRVWHCCYYAALYV